MEFLIILLLLSFWFFYRRSKKKKQKKPQPTKEDFEFLKAYNELLQSSKMTEEEKEKELRDAAKERGVNLR